MTSQHICETLCYGMFFGLLLGGCYLCERTKQEKEKTRQEAIKAGLIEKYDGLMGGNIWVKP